MQAVAVCFLYGFVDPTHEKRARAHPARRSCPTPSCRAGHEVAPEFREFERLSTVVVNAYLGPVMARLHRAPRRRASTALGMTATPHLTQSNGGVIGFDDGGATCRCAPCCPGPATGVVGAQAIGALAGFADLITFDMGGTSTDVALLAGRPAQARRARSTVHGYPIKAPMLDIHTVGAGGGSIAYIDSGGLLKVGPAPRRRRSRARSATAAATTSRPSPTPTSCCRR